MKTTLTLAALALAGAAGVAFAQTNGESEPPTVIEVPYGDVDLSQPGDEDVLMSRITSSASRACGGTPDSMLDLKSWSYYRICRRAAVDGALDQLPGR